MILYFGMISLMRRSAPRTSGDDPDVAEIIEDDARCSPHERG